VRYFVPQDLAFLSGALFIGHTISKVLYFHFHHTFCSAERPPATLVESGASGPMTHHQRHRIRETKVNVGCDSRGICRFAAQYHGVDDDHHDHHDRHEQTATQLAASVF